MVLLFNHGCQPDAGAITFAQTTLFEQSSSGTIPFVRTTYVYQNRITFALATLVHQNAIIWTNF